MEDASYPAGFQSKVAGQMTNIESDRSQLQSEAEEKFKKFGPSINKDFAEWVIK